MVGRQSEGVRVAQVSTPLIPKAPERTARQASEYAFGEHHSGGSSPSACFAGTSPKGRLVRLSAAAAKRSQRLRRLDICGGAANNSFFRGLL